ncbi:MAG: hypothetical protein IPP22_16765 [Nitrosomonas sp.]|nr:hypothetical protein [Nitrosomonas sp.]
MPSDERMATADYCTVDIDSIKLGTAQCWAGAYGLCCIAVFAAGCSITALGLNRAEVATAIGTIVGRMVAPDSELSTHRWLQRRGTG